jgi:hypothetical protein
VSAFAGGAAKNSTSRAEVVQEAEELEEVRVEKVHAGSF